MFQIDQIFRELWVSHQSLIRAANDRARVSPMFNVVQKSNKSKNGSLMEPALSALRTQKLNFDELIF